jgi:integrase
LGAPVGDAQERGLALRNPVRGLRRQRRKAPGRHKAKLAIGVDIPTPAEIRALLKAAQGGGHAFFSVAALAGLRGSELRGLRWQDGKPIEDEDGKVVMKPKYPGLHALRHFYCSWCAARPQDGGLGLPLKTVQVRMGHSSLAMTADRYGHLFPSQDDTEVLAAGERALMGA